MMNQNAMQGLMQAKPGMGDMEMMGRQEDPTQLLQEAISLHQRHMDGTEPATPESQEELMEMLMQALSLLGK